MIFRDLLAITFTSQQLTGNELHDNHDGLLLRGNADVLDNVGVVVLLEDPPLLQELELLVLRQGVLTRLHGHLARSLVHALVHLAKVTLAIE